MGCAASAVSRESNHADVTERGGETGSKERRGSFNNGDRRRGSFNDLSRLGISDMDQEECFKGIKTGVTVLCLDTFTSKYTKEVMKKWRLATVRVYDGSNKTTKALIHFDGWKDKFDKWIDLANTEKEAEIVPVGLLSVAQIEVGSQPTAEQMKRVLDFIYNGNLNTVGDTAASSEDGRSETPQFEESSDDSPSKKYRKGMIIDVLDVFSRGEGKQISYNWRKACVIEVAGSKLRVGYVGLGSEFDEIIDLEKEKGRVRDQGTMSDIHRGSSRQARRSFDGVPGSPAASTKKPAKSRFRSYDGKAFNEVFSQDMQSDSDDQPEKEDSELDSPVTDPAALLANKGIVKNKPQASPQSRKRRQISFTGKGGQVLPGAAVGYSPEKHDFSRRHSTSIVESGRRESTEVAFEERLERLGLHMVEMAADGNCLFRALAHQTFCNEEKHMELRAECVRHLLAHRDRFEIFCTSDFDAYCRRMAKDATWAGELEIRAMEEVLDRVVLIYSSESKAAKPVPMNTSFDEQLIVGMDVEPIKISYHYGCHYNSIYDQKYGFPLERRGSRVLQKARLKLISGMKGPPKDKD